MRQPLLIITFVLAATQFVDAQTGSPDDTDFQRACSTALDTHLDRPNLALVDVATQAAFGFGLYSSGAHPIGQGPNAICVYDKEKRNARGFLTRDRKEAIDIAFGCIARIKNGTVNANAEGMAQC